VAATCLLNERGEPARAAAFARVFDRLLVASQCLDDAIDRVEDQQLRGIDFPTALGCSAGALAWAAPPLLAWSAAEARTASFPRLSRWLGWHAAEIARSLAAPTRGWCQLAGMVVAAHLEPARSRTS
jgi:hypothetical protein